MKHIATIMMLVWLAACTASGPPEPRIALEPQTPDEIIEYTWRDFQRSGGPNRVKVGKPYRIMGQRYHPRLEPGYIEEGVASWYGPNFHGKLTANGEVYDQYGLTAAHRTLPLPSIVKVTNLHNGRELVVRINDRGPFAHDRIIDLSKRSAELLGMKHQGTSQVKVALLLDETEKLWNRLNMPPPRNWEMAKADWQYRTTRMASVPLPAFKTGAAQANALTSPGYEVAALDMEDALNVYPSTEPTAFFIQAAAYSTVENAEQAAIQLAMVGTPILQKADINGQRFYRLRVGPVRTEAEAKTLHRRLIDLGFKGASIVTSDQ